MRILVTYAVQGEFTELKFPGLIGEEEVQVGYLRTGVGKVKSAFYLSEAISHAQPDLVVNVGTAGTIRHQVGDIFVCRHFVDRDMQKLVEEGITIVMITHDLSLVRQYATRVVELEDGKVRKDLPTEAYFAWRREETGKEEQ